MKKIFALLLFISLCILTSYAQNPRSLSSAPKSRGALAFPYFQSLVQPDNSKVDLIIKGDGVVHWFETKQGDKVLRNTEGWFTYAVVAENGYMVSSDRIVGEGGNKSFNSIRLISKDVFFSAKQMREKETSYFGDISTVSDRYKTKGLYNVQFPSKGKRRSLMILAEFSDTPHVIDASVFNDIMNKVNYTPVVNSRNSYTGSFRDYYLENSYNKFDCTTDVVSMNNNGIDFIWVKLPNKLEYYGRNNSSGDDENAQAMIIDAVNAADAKGVDFSKYDNDLDGDVDNIMVIHTGYGEEAGAPDETIWSHKHNLGNKVLNIDGKTISAYITFPELLNASGNIVTSIGVLVHEFGHALGLPDYYDTDFSGGSGEAPGLGHWDVMSGGSYNNRGVTPAQHNAYSKYLLDWIDLIVLNDVEPSSSSPIEIKDLSSGDSDVSYILKTRTEDEFFILENRQQKKFDSNIPGHGMLVYHVDRNYSGDTWITNDINADPDHQCMELLFAGKKEIDSSSTPFPGIDNVRLLSDDSGKLKESYTLDESKLSNDPCFLSWDLERSSFYINSITEAAGVIKFNFAKSQNTNLYISVLFKYQTELVNINYEGDIIILKTIISDENTVEKEYSAILDRDGKCVIKDIIYADYKVQIESKNKKFVYDNRDVIVSFDPFYDVKINANDLLISLRLASIEDDNIKIFPNPTSDYIQIEASIKDRATITIYDMKGSLVLEKELFADDLDDRSLHGLDLSTLKAGVYNVVLVNGNKKLTKRVIKN